MLKDLILKNRSYRRFHEDKEISEETLLELVDLARLSPSARNAQPLKYLIVNTPDKNEKVFKHLSWAGYLKDWKGPKKGERPSAYLVMLNDTTVTANFFCDNGIASQSILLGAVEKGMGGCIIGSVERLQIQRDLGIPEHLKVVQVIALGYPNEEVVIEKYDNDHRYWRDLKDVHHVPKRSLEELVIKIS